jgi:hypothetical protein
MTLYKASFYCILLQHTPSESLHRHMSISGLSLEQPRAPYMAAVAGGRPRLLDHLRDVIRRKHYSLRTEEAYLAWVRRFVHFLRASSSSRLRAHRSAGVSQPSRGRGAGIRFAQNQARSALLFLYKEVQHEIVVREGKGFRDRVTMMPQALRDDLAGHMARVQVFHGADLRRGYGEVYLSYALARRAEQGRGSRAQSTGFCPVSAVSRATSARVA